MEITKNKLLSIIGESKSIEFDESKKELKRGSAYGEGTKFKRISIKDNIVLAGSPITRFDSATKHALEGTILIGWQANETPIFFTNVNSFKDLQKKDKNLWIKIKKLYKNIDIENIRFVTNPTIPIHAKRAVVKTFSKFDPRAASTDLDLRQAPPLKSFPAATKIKRKLFGLIRSYFERNPGMVGTFNLLTIPMLRIDKKFMDVTSDKMLSNDKVTVRLKSGIGFKDKFEYQKTIAEKNADVYQGDVKTDKMSKEYYLKRQYNKIYRNWPEIQRNNNEWLGKTKIYDLDRYNKSQNPYDVGIIVELEINGKRENDSFIWDVSFKQKKGTNLLNQGKYLPNEDFNINIRKVAELEPDEEFDDNYSIVDNPKIVNAMIEAIYELAKEIQQFSPSDMLRNAIIPQYDYDDVEEMNA